jgi:hypothetical protein
MARPADPFVEALMANPKQQTRQLESLMAGANHGSPA